MKATEVFYDGDKEPVQIGDIYLQDDKHSAWARGEWEVITIDVFPSNFARVTRRNLITGRIDVNGWNNTGKHLIRHKELLGGIKGA
mgnify:CR=1 FL=1